MTTYRPRASVEATPVLDLLGIITAWRITTPGGTRTLSVDAFNSIYEPITIPEVGPQPSPPHLSSEQHGGSPLPPEGAQHG